MCILCIPGMRKKHKASSSGMQRRPRKSAMRPLKTSVGSLSLKLIYSVSFVGNQYKSTKMYHIYNEP